MTTQFHMEPQVRTIPAPALLTGWAGVLPFAACAAFSIAGPPDLARMASGTLLSYGALILAFLGGVQWGLVMCATGVVPHWHHYPASTLPALVAFPAAFLPVAAALGLLAAGFLGLLVYDLRRVRAGWAPGWYARLRLQLSAAVLLLLALVAVAGPQS
jgi:hypothetical protein